MSMKINFSVMSGTVIAKLISLGVTEEEIKAMVAENSVSLPVGTRAYAESEFNTLAATGTCVVVRDATGKLVPGLRANIPGRPETVYTGKPMQQEKGIPVQQTQATPVQAQQCKTIEAILYTDGSCLGNPGPGGWAYCGTIGKEAVEAHGAIVRMTTNNVAELAGAYIALKAAVEAGATKVVLNIDSKYVEEGIDGIMRNGVPFKKMKENAKAWGAMGDLVKRIPDLTVRHIKGHRGDVLNEKADALARQGSAEAKEQMAQ